MSIELIVGLGNPGPDYADTRHNAGAWFVTQLAKAHSIALRAERKFHGLYGKLALAMGDVHLLIPTTYMNNSGQAITAVANFYKIPPKHILIAHDELDLPLGTLRLKQSGGHGGHNGLRDILEQLGAQADFFRLRIGIGHPGDKEKVTPYVLGKPSQAERNLIDGCINEAITVLPDILQHQQKAMHRLHTSASEAGNESKHLPKMGKDLKE